MKLLGHCFADAGLATLALTHRSMGQPHNERLEFLGDALLNMLVAEMLFETYPRADEGALSRMRAQLVSGAALADMARELELGAQLKLGPGELKSGGFRRASILADALEAAIAAVHLDAGFATCRERVRALFGSRVEAIHKPRKDPKSRLQEWLQGKGLPLPEYRLDGSHGEEHAKVFEVTCLLEQPQAMQFSADGASRRVAEQAAAAAALAALEGESR
ncbi:MAG TPA: ribonuclease III [Rhodanobacteraceae bacterium]|nr:ribonuclease III [Rhodanobacteraceae bacterium]